MEIFPKIPALIRQARVDDAEQCHTIRMSVKENMLSNPALISLSDYNEFFIRRGKGWVCEVDHQIGGFAVIDLLERNIWALFVSPGFQGLGIGKLLQKKMLDWYFGSYKEDIWLGTAPRTRAEIFYKNTGWQAAGIRKNGEIKFIMTKEIWQAFGK